MYNVAVERTFTASHSLRLGDQRREEPHEHLWRVRASVAAEELTAGDLVIDFHLLERLLSQAIEPLTRQESINQCPDFAQVNPSAERVARFLYERLAPLLPAQVELAQLTVWEARNCSASYQLTLDQFLAASHRKV